MWEMQQTGPQVQIHCIEETGFIQVECPTGAVDAAHKIRQVSRAVGPFPAAQYQAKSLCGDHMLRYLLLIAQAEAQLALTQPVVDLGQPTAARWLESDPINLNSHSQYPNINNNYNYGPPCIPPVTELNYEAVADIGLDHQWMQQALDDW